MSAKTINAVPPAPTIRDVTRELAHSINPLISQTGASDTASQCAMVTRMLGLLVSDDSGGIDMLGFNFLMETISCALEYEVDCSLIGKLRHEV